MGLLSEAVWLAVRLGAAALAVPVPAFIVRD